MTIRQEKSSPPHLLIHFRRKEFCRGSLLATHDLSADVAKQAIFVDYVQEYVDVEEVVVAKKEQCKCTTASYKLHPMIPQPYHDVDGLLELSISSYFVSSLLVKVGHYRICYVASCTRCPSSKPELFEKLISLALTPDLV